MKLLSVDDLTTDQFQDLPYQREAALHDRFQITSPPLNKLMTYMDQVTASLGLSHEWDMKLISLKSYLEN